MFPPRYNALHGADATPFIYLIQTFVIWYSEPF